jgi:hypothetical protein
MSICYYKVFKNNKNIVKTKITVPAAYILSRTNPNLVRSTNIQPSASLGTDVFCASQKKLKGCEEMHSTLL